MSTIRKYRIGPFITILLIFYILEGIRHHFGEAWGYLFTLITLICALRYLIQAIRS